MPKTRKHSRRRGGSDPTIPLEQVRQDIRALLNEVSAHAKNKNMEDLEEARKKATTAKERIQSLSETEKRVYSEEIDKILKGIDEAMEDKRYNASRAKRPRVEGGRRKRRRTRKHR